MIGALFHALQSRPKTWRTLFFIALAVLVALNVAIRPEEAHFGWDSLPGFFAVFGFAAGLVLLVGMAWIVRPLIGRKEDFYGDL